jgi:hypothetical protein
MFVSLRMSVDEAMEEFAQLCERVYNGKISSATARSNHLQSYLEDLMKRKELAIDLKLGQSPKESRCRGYGT